jgi:hypothetical protein
MRVSIYPFTSSQLLTKILTIAAAAPLALFSILLLIVEGLVKMLLVPAMFLVGLAYIGFEPLIKKIL